MNFLRFVDEFKSSADAPGSALPLYNSLFHKRIQSYFVSGPCSHSSPLSFVHIRPAHLGATSQTPLSCLEPISQPSKFMHPCTCDCHGLFVLDMASGVPAPPEFGRLIYKLLTVVISGLLIIAQQLLSHLFYRLLLYSGHYPTIPLL